MIDPTTKDAYAKRVGSLCSDSSVLTSSVLSDINQVFYSEGPDGDLSATNLSIRYMTSQEYHDLITGASGQFEPKTLYVISSDEINAYNTQIKNVASPNDDYDAANKLWVEQSIASALISAEDYSDALRPLFDNKLDKCSSGSVLSNNAMLAFGTGINVASGNQSIAIGNGVSAMDGKSIAIGQSTEVHSPYSLAFGENTYASGAGKAFAIGNTASATAAFSYAFGKNVEANGQHSYVIGLSSKANGNYSIAIGKSNTINSSKGNSEGVFVGGLSNNAQLGNNGPSFVYGRSNTLLSAGLNFIAGEKLSSSYNWSTVLGGWAKSTNGNQFVWSYGDSTSPYSPKNSQGTFNINPINGISGFYIKDKSLAEHLLGKADLDALANLCSSISISYDQDANAICLSAGDHVTSVDCQQFAKDTYLSDAQLCGTSLVMHFTENQPGISIELSSLSNDYSKEIYGMSSIVSCKIDSSAIAPSWEAKHYDNDDIVSFDGKLYVVTNDDYISQGQTPVENNSAWAQTNISAVISQAIAPLMQQIDQLTLSVNTLSNEVESLKNNS